MKKTLSWTFFQKIVTNWIYFPILGLDLCQNFELKNQVTKIMKVGIVFHENSRWLWQCYIINDKVKVLIEWKLKTDKIL